MSIPTKTIISEIAQIVNFYKPELVEQIAKDKGSYFLSRHNHRTGLYIQIEGNLVHFDIVQELKKSIEYSMDFMDSHRKASFSLGMESIHNEQEILDGRFARLLYSLRWQIELVFKSWKSCNGLTEIKGNRPERIECFTYGRLILLTIIAFLSGGIRRHLWNTKKREARFWLFLFYKVSLKLKWKMNHPKILFMNIYSMVASSNMFTGAIS